MVVAYLEFHILRIFLASKLCRIGGLSREISQSAYKLVQALTI